MKTRIGYSFFAVLAFLASQASADPIPGIVNTGVPGVGALDNSYNSPAATPGPQAPTGVQAFPGWVAAPSGSNWISQATTGAGAGTTASITSSPFGLGLGTFTNYTYNLSFSLNGFNPASAVIHLSVASDNGMQVFLNGVQKFSDLTNDTDTGNSSFFNALHAVTDITSSFNPLNNVLSFVVRNLDSAPNPDPTGLLVIASGTADPLQNIPGPVPEPTSMLLWGLLGAGTAVGGWYRRSRKLAAATV
jgi:hypothetical protein